MSKLAAFILSGLLFTATTACAQSVPTLTFSPWFSGLGPVLDIVRPPQDTVRLFLVEKTGRVRIVEDSAGIVGMRADFLDISSRIATSGEQGLLSLAFHPQYATNRMFWVLYTNTAGDLVLARYQTLASDPFRADTSSATIVKTIAHPGNTNHNGGKLIFGTDGLLYWSTGDGGGSGDPSNNAQNKAVLLGKMLRLNATTSATPPFYTAPISNPFVGQTGADSLVYQYGLRNPYRWSFDRLTGDMWIADVGQNAWEEVNYASAGSLAGIDWGWRCREGAHVFSTATSCAPGYRDPVFEYDHSAANGGLSITGGYVYRGSLYPALYGRYICVDFVNPNAWTVAPAGGSYVGTRQSGIPGQIAGFGENHRGELFAASLDGVLWRIGAQGGTPLDVDEAREASSLLVSPVPATPGVPLVLRREGLREAALTDVQGREVFRQTLNASNALHTLNLPVLPAGMYVLRCTTQNGDVFVQRIVVQ